DRLRSGRRASLSRRPGIAGACSGADSETGDGHRDLRRTASRPERSGTFLEPGARQRLVSLRLPLAYKLARTACGARSRARRRSSAVVYKRKETNEEQTWIRITTLTIVRSQHKLRDCGFMRIIAMNWSNFVRRAVRSPVRRCATLSTKLFAPAATLRLSGPKSCRPLNN